jgi:hypothetical protein
MSFLQKVENGLAAGLFILFVSISISTPAAAQGGGFCAALLSGNPQGGAALEAEVSNLIAAAPDAAGDVVACAAQANKEQSASIGAGLSSVVAGLKQTNPELADQIAALVAASGNTQLIAGYSGGDGNEATAAIPGDQGDGAQNDSAATTQVGISGPTVSSLSVGSSGGGSGGGAVSPN